RGVVNGDDGPQPARFVEAKQHLLVLVVVRIVEEIHSPASFVTRTQATRSTMRTTCESSCRKASSLAARVFRYCSAAFSLMCPKPRTFCGRAATSIAVS